MSALLSQDLYARAMDACLGEMACQTIDPDRRRIVSRAALCLFRVLPDAQREQYLERIEQVKSEQEVSALRGLRKQVVEAMTAEPGRTWSPSEVRGSIDKQIDLKRVHNALHYLGQEGLVVRVGRGRFILSDGAGRE